MIVLIAIAMTAELAVQGAHAPAPELAVMEQRIADYIRLHRKAEGPLPPLMVTNDMGTVRRIMGALRGRIRDARGPQPQGAVFTPEVVKALRSHIASCLTPDEIAETMEAIAEHTPAGMRPIRVNEPMPEDAPFGFIPPRLLHELPALPPELRYVLLSNALLLWDHHADLVVDFAPGLMDATTYKKGPDAGRR